MSQLDSGQLLRQAVEHHRAGRVREAEVICRQVIQQDANNSEAFNLLGVARHSLRARASLKRPSRLFSSSSEFRGSYRTANDLILAFCSPPIRI